MMKQIADGILFTLIILIIFKCISLIIFSSSSKEYKLKYYTKRWNDYLKQKEKANKVIERIVNVVNGIKVIIACYISDQLLKVILACMEFLLITTFKELRLKNIIEKPINFIYLRRYNPESIKANITRLENQYGKSLLLTL